MKTELSSDPGKIQSFLIEQKRKGRRIVIVPTMGALHAGHRTLMAEGRKQGDILIVSIFVNPTQFGPNEDLAKYPRNLEDDLRMCEDEGVDIVFAPSTATIYPPDYSTHVEVEGLGKRLCGQSRPIHFRGVATIVSKLFLITQADVGVFGWKDAQQLLIIRRMVRDLNMPVTVMGVETVRETDGLALSSRNKYLTPVERAEAPVLFRALQSARERYEKDRTVGTEFLRKEIRGQIESESSGRIDYVEIVEMECLKPIEQVLPGNTLIAVACFWGGTRLIDNIRL